MMDVAHEPCTVVKCAELRQARLRQLVGLVQQLHGLESVENVSRVCESADPGWQVPEHVLLRHVALFVAAEEQRDGDILLQLDKHAVEQVRWPARPPRGQLVALLLVERSHHLQQAVEQRVVVGVLQQKG